MSAKDALLKSLFSHAEWFDGGSTIVEELFLGLCRVTAVLSTVYIEVAVGARGECEPRRYKKTTPNGEDGLSRLISDVPLTIHAQFLVDLQALDGLAHHLHSCDTGHRPNESVSRQLSRKEQPRVK